MNKKIILTGLFLIFFINLKANAAIPDTDSFVNIHKNETGVYEVVESEDYDGIKIKETRCFSKWDSNNTEYCGFDFMSSKSLIMMYKKHRIWVPGIIVRQKNRCVIVKFQSVPGADGYQISYSDKIVNKWTDAVFLKNPIKKDTRKKKIVLKIKRKKTMYVQIRPFKKINGKRVFGRWSSIYAYSDESDKRIGTSIYLRKID